MPPSPKTRYSKDSTAVSVSVQERVRADSVQCAPPLPLLAKETPFSVSGVQG